MNSNSSIYMGDDGNYHDKPADYPEQAPEPTEEGDLPGVTAEPLTVEEETTEAPIDETTATAKTRKQ